MASLLDAWEVLFPRENTLLSQLLTQVPRDIHSRQPNRGRTNGQYGHPKAQTKCRKHRRRHERDHKPEDTTEDGSGAECAGRMKSISIDEILVDAEELHIRAGGQKHSTDVRHDDVEAVLRTPPIPEEANDGKNCCGQEQRQSKLGEGFFVRRARGEAFVYQIANTGVDLGHDDDPDAGSEEV